MSDQRLHLGDNLQFMISYPDNHWDLAIVDPQTGQDEGKKHSTRPYNVRQKNGNKIEVKRSHIVSEWDKEPPTQHYWDELFRVSKHQIIMCENYLHFTQKDTSAGRIVWYLMRKNDFSACNIMWTSLTNKIDFFSYLWSGMMQGEAINSRQQYGNKKLNEKRRHPSQKPLKVYKYLLKKYALPGWSILDTHGGSMNLAFACFDLGFDCDVVEKEEYYYNDGLKQLEAHKRQLKLL